MTTRFMQVSSHDMPLQREAIERSRRLRFSRDVVAPVVAAFGLSAGALAGFGALWLEPPQALAAGTGGSCLAGLIMLLWRLAVWDGGRIQQWHEREYQQVEPHGVDGHRWAPVNGEPAVIVRRSKTIEYGEQTITFTGRQLDIMLASFDAGKRRLTRDVCRWSGDAYPGVVSALHGRKLIDDNNEWTAAGVAWLRQE